MKCDAPQELVAQALDEIAQALEPVEALCEPGRVAWHPSASIHNVRALLERAQEELRNVSELTDAIDDEFERRKAQRLRDIALGRIREGEFDD